METILFVVSATIVINYLVIMIGAIFGNGISIPVPILHFWHKTDFANVYLSTFALSYQIYFWFNHFILH